MGKSSPIEKIEQNLKDMSEQATRIPGRESGGGGEWEGIYQEERSANEKSLRWSVLGMFKKQKESGTK